MIRTAFAALIILAACSSAPQDRPDPTAQQQHADTPQQPYMVDPQNTIAGIDQYGLWGVWVQPNGLWVWGRFVVPVIRRGVVTAYGWTECESPAMANVPDYARC